jgi:toluene monooxygenase electron transfer component
MKNHRRNEFGRFDFECGATDKLLHAGLPQGLTLPYECATGTCGTCRGRIMQGSVHRLGSGADSAKLKRDKGDVLMCQTRPSSDCVVRVPQGCGEAGSDTLPQHRTAHIDAPQTRPTWSISSLRCRAR